MCAPKRRRVAGTCFASSTHGATCRLVCPGKIADAGRLGNFTGKFCTDGGKLMVKFLCEFRWICY